MTIFSGGLKQFNNTLMKTRI